MKHMTKKISRTLALVMACAMLLCVSAFAIDEGVYTATLTSDAAGTTAIHATAVIDGDAEVTSITVDGTKHAQISIPLTEITYGSATGSITGASTTQSGCAATVVGSTLTVTVPADYDFAVNGGVYIAFDVTVSNHTNSTSCYLYLA